MTEFDDALASVRDQFGDQSIFKMSDRPAVDVDVIPTGSLALDHALGVGGHPRGRIVEVYGSESSGKTTLALHAITECQKQGGHVAFIDAEHALDPKYAEAIGVDMDRIGLCQPNSGERALAITEALVKSGGVDLIVVDSVAALVPEAEISGDLGDQQVGLQARLMSHAMRKLTSTLGGTQTIVMFINQLRSNINTSGWGAPNQKVTSGGVALKYHASLRLDIRRTGPVKGSGEKMIGNQTKVRVVKNKLAPPFKEADFEIIYGEGISRPRELIRLGQEYGLVQRNGAHFKYGEVKLGQGLANAGQTLRDQPELDEQLEREIREATEGSP